MAASWRRCRRPIFGCCKSQNCAGSGPVSRCRMAFSVSMTGGLSAGPSSSSAMACASGMRRRLMGRTRHVTQPVRRLEPPGRVQPDPCRAGGEGRQARSAEDRCHAFEGTSHRRKPAKKGALPRYIGRTKGGRNSKLHAVCDGKGRPLVMLLSEGQASDHHGAALLLNALPPA